MSTIESLLSQLGQAATTADASIRYKLSGQLQHLARSIATPRQMLQHYGYTYTEQVAAKIANDLDLFTILSQSEGPLKSVDIASKCGGDAVLIGLEHGASQQGFILTSARSHLEAPCCDVYDCRSRGLDFCCERNYSLTSISGGQGKHHVWVQHS
jgi:hypothetical protein